MKLLRNKQLLVVSTWQFVQRIVLIEKSYKRLSHYLYLPGLLCFLTFLTACSSAKVTKEAALNAELSEELLPESTFQLESRGWLSILQEFQEVKDTHFSCEQVSKMLNITLLASPSAKSPVPQITERRCEDQNKLLIVRTAQPLAIGTYELKIQSKIPKDAKMPAPRLLIEYVEPNYAAGAAQLIAGSDILEKNAVAPGTVNLAKGIQTHWYHVVGNTGSTTLGYLLEGEQTPLHVSVHRMQEDLNNGKLITTLQPKVAASFELNTSPLYLKVEGPAFTRELKYLVFRKDAAELPPPVVEKKPPPILIYPLIERYVLSNHLTVLVIRSDEKLRVGADLNVKQLIGQLTGKKAGKHKTKDVGTCKIISIDSSSKGPQASCQIEGVDFSQIKAIQVELPPQGEQV